MMRFKRNNDGFEFTRKNGEVVKFDPMEIAFLSHECQKLHWHSELEKEIEQNSENIDFSEMTVNELIDYCIKDMDERWKNNTLEDEPDYEGIVFDGAQENNIWRY